MKLPRNTKCFEMEQNRMKLQKNLIFLQLKAKKICWMTATLVAELLFVHDWKKIGQAETVKPLLHSSKTYMNIQFLFHRFLLSFHFIFFLYFFRNRSVCLVTRKICIFSHKFSLCASPQKHQLNVSLLWLLRNGTSRTCGMSQGALLCSGFAFPSTNICYVQFMYANSFARNLHPEREMAI